MILGVKHQGLFLAVGLFTVGAAQADHVLPGSCTAYVERAEVARRTLTEFDRWVMQPLRQERVRVEKLLTREVRRPQELESAISEKERDNLKRESIIKQYDTANGLDQKMADSLIQQGKSAEAQKYLNQIAKRNTEISKYRAKIESEKIVIEGYRAERDEILATPPSEGELRLRLADLDSKLMDEARLRREKELDLQFANDAVNLCRNYAVLYEAHEQLKRDCGR